MKQPKILLFNGPPGSGKDTAAKALLHDADIIEDHDIRFDRFSRPLKRALAAFFELACDGYDITPLESGKNEAMPGYDVSFRQLQIDLSESFAKPHLGSAIFGELLVRRIRNWMETFVDESPRAKYKLVLVPDAGFLSEFIPLVEAFGEDRVAVCKFIREGTNYDSDSRGYLELSAFPSVVQFSTRNDDSVEELMLSVKAGLGPWLFNP